MLDRRLFLLSGLCGLCLAGCGGSGPERQPLRGAITIDGVELEQGAISLRPAVGHSAPAAVTTVDGGHYRFDRENGPLPGPYSVKINVDAESAQGKAILGKGSTTGNVAIPIGPKGESMLPPSRDQRQQAQPKLHWELEYTVPEDGSNTKDFELSS